MQPQPDEEAGAEDAGEKPKNEGTRSLQERYGYNPLILAENTHPEQGFDMRKNPCEIVNQSSMYSYFFSSLSTISTSVLMVMSFFTK